MNLSKEFSKESEFIDVVAMNWFGFYEIKLQYIREDISYVGATLASTIFYMTFH